MVEEEKFQHSFGDIMHSGQEVADALNMIVSANIVSVSDVQKSPARALIGSGGPTLIMKGGDLMGVFLPRRELSLLLRELADLRRRAGGQKSEDKEFAGRGDADVAQHPRASSAPPQPKAATGQ